MAEPPPTLTSSFTVGQTTYYCARCGKQMGGFPGCDEGYCVCQPVIQTPPYPQYGWACPKCGRGCAPTTATCPCIGTVTIYGNTGGGVEP